MSLTTTTYGEQFARNCLKKFYAKAITPAIASMEYEGEIKNFGDRVSIKSFLTDLVLEDYTIGTDMTVQHPTDSETQLIIDQKKDYCFDIDQVDKLFSFANDIDSTLIENASKVLEKAIDTRLLQVYIEDVKAGNRVPLGKTNPRAAYWTYAIGDTGTFVTITTSATVGTATLTGMRNGNPEVGAVSAEAGAFPVNIVGRGFRITSNLTNSPWYRITSRTSSTVITFNNWDGSISGGGQTIEGIMGIGGNPHFDGGGAGYGCEIEGMISTQVTASNIYSLVCDLARALDDDDVPPDGRHLSCPSWFYNTLVQASQIQPAIAIAYESVVKNGEVARVSGFAIHLVSEDRFSTETDPISCFEGWDSHVGTKILANRVGWIFFGHKWSESRIVKAEKQFANLYQGLNLYGFIVPAMRRKAGAYLYGYE